MANVKFLKSGSNFKVKVRRSKIVITIERSCHKKHTYHSKDMANVKSFCRQADKQIQTGQKLYASNLSIWGHENTNESQQ
jgi:hypothetical protein